MKSVPLTAFPRSEARRSRVRKLRATGRIPAIIYGRQAQPQNLEVEGQALKDLLHHSASENLLVDLTVDKDARAKRLALVQEIQHHPLSGQVLHIDFHEIQENEKVTVSVPVEAIGEAAGVKTGGGVLEHVLHKIRVRCLPKDLPEAINIDVSALEIGRAIHIGEIPALEGVEILGDKTAPVFAVAAPVTEEQEAAAAAAAAPSGEVEMIKEKKEDGEAAAPAKAGDKPAAAKPGDKAAPAADKAAGKEGDKKPAAEKKK
ncbi:MAG: large subunit ribosomal protein [Verrucomicrobiota bacterium]|jgi:large subunit ribosomal protein L25